ncbi:MAG: DUF1570 domain-containing protein [Kiritimatiellaeota bacterium]|nr:DUF1570 domain-containing protein [Kiritimatiellota bacterium]
MAAGHLGVSAAPSFQADKSLPSLGLKMRVLGNSTPEPLPQPQVHTYTVTRGAEKTQHDMFSARELWYASQHAGQWRDGAGNVMIAAQPTTLLPTAQEDILRNGTDHVTRKTYEAAAAACALDASSEEALSAWVAAFTGIAPSGVEKLRTQQNFNLSSALFFASDDPKTLVWAFRVKVRGGTSGQARPSGWYAVVLQLNDGSPKLKVRQGFEAQFFANVAAFSPTGANNANTLKDKALTPKAAVGGASAPGRDEAIKSIENMDGWWYAEAADYIFLSNIRSAAGKSLVRDLQNTLPTLRQAFAKVVAPFSDKAEVNVVRIFDTKDAYASYVGSEIEWSIGCWIPSRRELCILSKGADSREDKEQTVMIIRHEAFHQYLFYASDGVSHAVWFNEGHACFFEVAEIDAQRRVEIRESHRKRQLMEDMDAVAQNIPAVLAASHSQFYDGDNKRRNLNYTTAWALVHFLRAGTFSGKTAAYANILSTYHDTLKATKNAEAATEEAFKDIDMKAFQAAFQDFWRKGTTKRLRL